MIVFFFPTFEKLRRPGLETHSLKVQVGLIASVCRPCPWESPKHWDAMADARLEETWVGGEEERQVDRWTSKEPFGAPQAFFWIGATELLHDLRFFLLFSLRACISMLTVCVWRPGMETTQGEKPWLKTMVVLPGKKTWFYDGFPFFWEFLSLTLALWRWLSLLPEAPDESSASAALRWRSGRRWMRHVSAA